MATSRQVPMYREHDTWPWTLPSVRRMSQPNCVDCEYRASVFVVQYVRAVPMEASNAERQRAVDQIARALHAIHAKAPQERGDE